MDYVIGIDFDNTLISYDALMYNVGLKQGLIDSYTKKAKNHIRDQIRQLRDGETKWQRLQALVYGSMIEDAKLIDGVQAFFDSCKRYNVRVYIISHKTEFAKLEDTKINLRASAINWMKKNRFFKYDGLRLSQEDVYFEATRLDKINRIKQCFCTHFIDDLEELFLEDSFPANVGKILFSSHLKNSSLPGIKVIATWKEINDYFFTSIN